MKIGIIGMGNMGQIFAKSWALQGHQIIAVNRNNSPANEKIRFVETIEKLESLAEIILLAVKPQDLPNVCASLNGHKKIISIAAGIELAKISSWCKTGLKNTCRVMPNLAAQVKKGIHLIYCLDNDFFSVANKLFTSSGITERLHNEEDIHLATILYACLPAYFFEMLTDIQKISNEIKKKKDQQNEQWQRLMPQVLIGMAELMRDTNTDELVQSIASPGGVTEAGLAILRHKQQMKILLENSIEMALQKSKFISAK